VSGTRSGYPEQALSGVLRRFLEKPLKIPLRIFLFFLTIIVTLSPGCALRDTPRHSLAEFRTALLNRDAETALRYVDTDSIVELWVKDLFLKQEEASSDNPLALLGVRAGKGVANALMPGMKAMAKRQLKAAIASEDQWGYFNDIRKASVWYLSIHVDGDMAIVRPMGGSSTSFRMVRTDQGYWKIVEIKKGG
jgi:hypothetical protein